MAASENEWPREGLESIGACPVCGERRRALLYDGLTDRIWFSAPGRWSLHRCLACRSAFLDPRPTPSSIALAYATYYTHEPQGELGGSDFRAAVVHGYLNSRYGYRLAPASRLGPVLGRVFRKRGWYADRLVRNLPAPAGGGRLLDVGCGAGEFLVRMRDAGWDVEGLEPDPAAARQARAAGLDVVDAPLEGAELEPSSFDAITMSHVIEHVHEPLQALRICRQALKRGGLLWLATPNLDAVGHRWYGRDWIGLDPPRHLVLFVRESLAAALRTAGYESQRFVRDYSAERVLPCSATVAAGDDPRDTEVVWRHRSALRVLVADVVARIAARRVEELVVLATA